MIPVSLSINNRTDRAAQTELWRCPNRESLLTSALGENSHCPVMADFCRSLLHSTQILDRIELTKPACP